MDKKYFIIYAAAILIALLLSGYWYFLNREIPAEPEELSEEEMEISEILKNLDAQSSEPLEEEQEIISQISAPQQDPKVREEKSRILDLLSAPQ